MARGFLLSQNGCTVPGAHAASCGMGTGDYCKAAGTWIGHSSPSGAEVKNAWSYTSSHLTAFMANTGTPLLFPFKVAVTELMYCQ